MSSHSEYFTLKYQKLEGQNKAKAFLLNSATVSNIFKEVAVYITGHTEPPNSELKEMILQNGGSVRMFFRKSAITHIIASNLPDVKRKLWKNDLVVEPQWIVDCVKAQKLLPVAKYILYRQEVNIKDIYDSKDDDDSKGHPIPETTSANFVGDFYSNSRLHHLSTSATELRHYASKFQAEYHPSFFPSNFDQTSNMVMVHVDIDCFFVAIALRKKPHLRGLPVCVTHGNPGEKPNSYAEISSCSYEARAHGVRNGMFMGKATALCPTLVTVPYEFEEYQNASQEFYRILISKTPKIEVVSCDEAYIEISDIVECDDESLISTFVTDLRDEIHSAIGCTVSTGVGSNKLLARMATRIAKPNGQHLCMRNEQEFILTQRISDLPGVGYNIEQKLTSNGYLTCKDLINVTQDQLAAFLGPKTGKTIYNFSRGIDDRLFITKHERKSISVEINYGIRLSTLAELSVFLNNLAGELHKRMKNEGVQGNQISLKLKIRAEGESTEPLKHMGHGICDNVSKTTNVSKATNSPTVIHQKVMELIRAFNPVISDIRGVGIHLGKLTSIKTIVAPKDKVSCSPVPCDVFKCPTPAFLGRENPSEVEELLLPWFRSEDPYEHDVEEVEQYLQSLIPYGNISFLERILKTFRKIVLKRNCDEWTAVFNAFLNNIQIAIHKVHKGVLDIEQV